ncbi:unnamed protein product [Pleuronectes platessa]|uniref:Uncharacterized protein n=1 Tax=Pleuronectes platessa TaxID=8262 RepID=A0A9N7UEI2_PLEPL|nr:unnamed protein product [Pleuronectes platessa]
MRFGQREPALPGGAGMGQDTPPIEERHKAGYCSSSLGHWFAVCPSVKLPGPQAADQRVHKVFKRRRGDTGLAMESQPLSVAVHPAAPAPFSSPPQPRPPDTGLERGVKKGARPLTIHHMRLTRPAVLKRPRRSKMSRHLLSFPRLNSHHHPSTLIIHKNAIALQETLISTPGKQWSRAAVGLDGDCMVGVTSRLSSFYFWLYSEMFVLILDSRGRACVECQRLGLVRKRRVCHPPNPSEHRDTPGGGQAMRRPRQHPVVSETPPPLGYPFTQNHTWACADNSHL